MLPGPKFNSRSFEPNNDSGIPAASETAGHGIGDNTPAGQSSWKNILEIPDPGFPGPIYPPSLDGYAPASQYTFSFAHRNIALPPSLNRHRVVDRLFLWTSPKDIARWQ